MGSSCADCLIWGWNTVCNSIVGSYYPVTMVYANGYYPVGDYTYDTSISTFNRLPTNTIIEQNGETVAKSIANWCLLDTDRMRLARITEEMTRAYANYDFGEEFFTYARPEIMEEADVKYSIRVSNKELDTNKHLNNQTGAEL